MDNHSKLQKQYPQSFLDKALAIYTDIREKMSPDEIVEHIRDLQFRWASQQFQYIMVGCQYYMEVGLQDTYLRDAIQWVKRTSRKPVR